MPAAQSLNVNPVTVYSLVIGAHGHCQACQGPASASTGEGSGDHTAARVSVVVIAADNCSQCTEPMEPVIRVARMSRHKQAATDCKYKTLPLCASAACDESVQTPSG